MQYWWPEGGGGLWWSTHRIRCVSMYNIIHTCTCVPNIYVSWLKVTSKELTYVRTFPMYQLITDEVDTLFDKTWLIWYTSRQTVIGSELPGYIIDKALLWLVHKKCTHCRRPKEGFIYYIYVRTCVWYTDNCIQLQCETYCQVIHISTWSIMYIVHTYIVHMYIRMVVSTFESWVLAQFITIHGDALARTTSCAVHSQHVVWNTPAGQQVDQTDGG